MTTTSETTSDTDNKTDVIVKKKQNLRVVIYYAKKDDNFPKAGKYRLRRLQEAFPEHKGNQTRIFGVVSVADFTKAWNEIETLSKKYLLKRIHLFGHGNQHNLYFAGESLGLAGIKELCKLEWSPDGVMVIHTCRSGLLLKVEKEGSETCIAQELSRSQGIRVIGTSIKAGFSKTKDRRNPILDSAYFANDIYLWGYKSGSEVERVHGNDEEYKLVENYKIWACFQYAKDKQLPRILKNIETDLYFI